MARNEFEKEIGDLLKSLFPVAERLDDAAYNRSGGRQVKKKPYDYFGAMGGRFWGAEVKRVKSHLFPLRNLKDHQHEGLSNLVKNDCYAWVFVNWRTPKLPGLHGTGIAIWIDYPAFMLAVSRAILNGHASLRPEDLDEGLHLVRTPGGWAAPRSWNSEILQMESNFRLRKQMVARNFGNHLSEGK